MNTAELTQEGLSQQRQGLIEQARGFQIEVEGRREFKITNDEQYEHGGVVLTTIRALFKSGKAFFAESIKTTDVAHKAAIATRDAALVDLDVADRGLNQALKDYLTERNRLQAAKDKEIEDARLDAAAKVEATGDKDLANAMMETPLPKAAPPPAASGLTPRANWKARVVDLRLLLLHAAECLRQGRDEGWVEPNIVKLNELARGCRKEGAQLCGGVECYNDPVIATARR